MEFYYGIGASRPSAPFINCYLQVKGDVNHRCTNPPKAVHFGVAPKLNQKKVQQGGFPLSPRCSRRQEERTALPPFSQLWLISAKRKGKHPKMLNGCQPLTGWFCFPPFKGVSETKRFNDLHL